MIRDHAHHLGHRCLHKHIPGQAKLPPCLDLPQERVELAQDNLVLRSPVERSGEVDAEVSDRFVWRHPHQVFPLARARIDQVQWSMRNCNA